jgi:hypothetical protein
MNDVFTARSAEDIERDRKVIDGEKPNYIIKKNLLSREECDCLIKEIYGKYNFVESETYGGIDKNVRSVKVAYITDEKIRKRFYNIILDLNKKYWNYDIHEDYTIAVEPLHLCLYLTEDKGHYTWHKDSIESTGCDHMRKLSFSLLLNDKNSWSGGDLQIHLGLSPNGNPLMGDTSSLNSMGDMCVFTSSTYHRVTPVTRNHRLALVGFIRGKNFK